MKEYSITLTFAVETKKSDYEDVSEFAEQLIDKILDNDNLTIKRDIEIVDITLDKVEDYSIYKDDEEDEEDEDYLNEE